MGTFVLFFAMLNFLKIMAYLEIEILTSETVLLTTILSPLIILGGFVGNALNKRVSQKAFIAIVFAAILAIEINLLTKKLEDNHCKRRRNPWASKEKR